MLKRLQELCKVQILQRRQHIIRADRLPFGVLARVVGGGGEVVDEQLGGLAAGQ